jgi:hypothetical protein
MTQPNFCHPRVTLTTKLSLPLVVLFAGFTALSSLRALASDITVGSPAAGTRISSPVLIRAHNAGCAGALPTGFGYSIDEDRSVLSARTPYNIDVQRQALSPGTHTVHFRSWTRKGECPESTTTFTVADPAEPPTAPSIPPNAISSGDLDAATNWTEGHDGGTPGESVGTTLYPVSNAPYDNDREFDMTYTKRAGERWSADIVKDTTSTHFVLDLYVFFPNPSEVRNLEMDVNHVLENGDTVILSTQCSGEIGFWEYGDTKNGHDHWKSTKIPCNPANWTANVWHHVQIGEHHTPAGLVTHDWVTVDEVYTPFVNATLPSIHAEHWTKGSINMQFQIEGSSQISGAVTAFTNNLTVYRW